MENGNTIDERRSKIYKTYFWLATGSKLQTKTLFLAIFDLLSSIDKSVFDYRLSGVFFKMKLW